MTFDITNQIEMSKSKGNSSVQRPPDTEDLEIGRSERAISEKFGNKAPTPSRNTNADTDNGDDPQKATAEVQQDKVENVEEEEDPDEEDDDDDDDDDDE